MSASRYALDPSGVNRDNAVVGESHSLSTAQYRAVAPTYGPFFTESVVVYDQINNSPLTKGTDFICVELLQEATLKYGKEIAQLILIVNPNISSDVRISYQTLGGLYENTADAVARYYETLMLDNRPVDYINVLNKPQEFPPSLHKHLLNEIVGFEPVVASLERIRNALLLTDVPAYELLVDWVKVYVANNTGFDLEALLAAAKVYNFNSIRISKTSGRYNAGAVDTYDIETSNYADNTNVYWTIEHIDTDTNDFASLSGVFSVVGNRGSFNVSILSDAAEVEDKKYKIYLRKDSIDGYVLAETSFFVINKTTGGTGGGGGGTGDDLSLARILTECCFIGSRAKKNARNLYYFGD